MLYSVAKNAVDDDFITRIEEIVGELPVEKGATVENDDYSTRNCDLRWIHYGRPGFDFIQDRFFAALHALGIDEHSAWVLENLQITAYGPNDFHNWHIDAYRRTYNKYDTPLGDRFIDKKRVLSASILLNGHESFTGGSFEISMFPNGDKTVGTALEDFCDAGDLAFFDAALCHRVAPVKTGLRKTLVAWICA